MEKIIEELNQDFELQVVSLKQYIMILEPHKRAMAIEWLNKLQQTTDYQQISLKLDEARLRNDFLYVLSKYCFQGELFRPFDRPPPGGPLLGIKNKLPTPDAMQKNIDDAEYYADDLLDRPEIFKRAPDKGKFLLGQPVPRNGIFCYVAVVNANK